MSEIEEIQRPVEHMSNLRKSGEVLYALASAAITDRLMGPDFTNSHSRFQVRELTDGDIDRANRLVYGEYVRFGQLDPARSMEESLPEDGTVFGVMERKTGELTATARFIYPKNPDDEIGPSGLASLEYPFDQVSDEARDMLAKIDPATVAEFRCLAKKPGTSQLPMAQLIRSLYKYSRDNGIRYWLSAFDPGPFDSVTRRFAALGSMTRLSDGIIRYPGNLTPKIPVLVDILPESDQSIYMNDINLSRREKLISRVATGFVKRGGLSR